MLRPSWCMGRWGNGIGNYAVRSRHLIAYILTHKHLETHGCVFWNVATDALVIKHQAVSIHSADEIVSVWDQSHTNTSYFLETIWENVIAILK